MKQDPSTTQPTTENVEEVSNQPLNEEITPSPENDNRDEDVKMEELHEELGGEAGTE